MPGVQRAASARHGTIITLILQIACAAAQQTYSGIGASGWDRRHRAALLSRIPICNNSVCLTLQAEQVLTDLGASHRLWRSATQIVQQVLQREKAVLCDPDCHFPKQIDVSHVEGASFEELAPILVLSKWPGVQTA